MKFKHYFCYVLCFSILLCVTACNKYTLTETSSFVEVVYEEEIYENLTESTQSQTHNSSQIDSVESNFVTSSKPEDKKSFSELKSIEYVCTKDIPGYDVVYTIESLLTNTNINIVNASEFVCETEGIRIEGNKVFVPQDIKNKKNQILITARHKNSGISEVFDITFDGSWNMIFEDEFNGTEIDKSVWDHYPEWPIEKGYAGQFSKDLTFLDGNGNLVSRAYCSGDKDNQGRTKYFAGGIRSQGRFESTYGYYEIRVKPHRITGAWGSFWIVAGDMNKPAVYDQSSKNGVVLTLEMYKEYNYINHGIAWDGMDEKYICRDSSGVWYNTKRVTDNFFDGNFHTLAVRWTKDEYIFYIDGKESYRRDAIGGGCERPGYLNITTEFSEFAGDVLLKAGEHSDMLVDYVRVYQNTGDPT